MHFEVYIGRFTVYCYLLSYQYLLPVPSIAKHTAVSGVLACSNINDNTPTAGLVALKKTWKFEPSGSYNNMGDDHLAFPGAERYLRNTHCSRTRCVSMTSSLSFVS